MVWLRYHRAHQDGDGKRGEKDQHEAPEALGVGLHETAVSQTDAGQHGHDKNQREDQHVGMVEPLPGRHGGADGIEAKRKAMTEARLTPTAAGEEK